MPARTITRIYVRRYSDNGQVTAYAEYADGSRFESTLFSVDLGHGRGRVYSFGPFTHSLFARAKREGLKLQRETW